MSVSKASVVGIGEELAKKAQKLESSYTKQLTLEMQRIDQRYKLYRGKAALELDLDRKLTLLKDMNTQMNDELEAVSDRVLKRMIFELKDMCETACIELRKLASNVDVQQSLRQGSVLPRETVEWLESIEENLEENSQEGIQESVEEIIEGSQRDETVEHATSASAQDADRTNPTDHTRSDPPPPAFCPQPLVLDSPEGEPAEAHAEAQLPTQEEEAEQQIAGLERAQAPRAQPELSDNEQAQEKQIEPVSLQRADSQPTEPTRDIAASPASDPHEESVTSVQETPILRRTPRAVNTVNSRANVSILLLKKQSHYSNINIKQKKRRAGRHASRSSSKRQRSTEVDEPLCDRSVLFQDVYQNGQALQKREILRHGSFFYYVECTKHKQVYDGKTNSFRAASKHFRGDDHSSENNMEHPGAHPIIIARFGVHVTDCTDAKAALNNKILHRARMASASLDHAGSRRTGPRRLTSSELDAVTPKVLKTWEVYAGFVGDSLRPVPVVVLPVLGTVSNIGLLPDHKEAFLRGLPTCVKYDKNAGQLLGWTDEYQDGQAKACQRLYPVLGFNTPKYSKTLVMQWATIEDLGALKFDPEHTGEDKRQRTEALWFADQQRIAPSATTIRPSTTATAVSSLTAPECMYIN